jgi:high-affinity nickel permease
MFGLDEHVAALAAGHGFLLVAVVAVLLGLRHATDPDHLTAVLALMAGTEERRDHRRAAGLGLAWGAGHGTSLVVLGVPIVLFESYLPEAVQRGAEVLVGLMIIALAARLLLRLRRTRVHGHAHDHGHGAHDHLHVHATALDRAHVHAHPAPSRTGRQAYAIGAVHGIGGTAGVGLLLLAAIPGHAQGTVALLLFAGCSALAMAAASIAFGLALTGRRLAARERLTPVLGTLSLAFGVWYVLGAAEVVPYIF